MLLSSMTRRRALVILTGVLVLALAAGAFAAGSGVRKGPYAPHESWVTNHTSASVDLTVGRGGRTIAAKGTGLSCPNNGNAPLVGSYAGIPFTTQLPHSIPISGSGHFSFSGTVKVSAYEDQTAYPITTHFAISGQFNHGTIKPLKTIAVRGKVSSDYCTAKTPGTFKLVLDPTG